MSYNIYNPNSRSGISTYSDISVQTVRGVLFKQIAQNNNFKIGYLQYEPIHTCIVCGQGIELDKRIILFTNNSYAHEECLNEKAAKEIEFLLQKATADKV
jgi:hypothetical protein